jgi:L-threonylcarbamoyladenylate synthase
MIERYTGDCPPIAFELASVSDNPLTIIYPEGKNLANGVCGNDGSIAIRLCRDRFCNELIGRFRKPVVSTSANVSGNPSPGNFSDIEHTLINNADYVVKYRQDDRSKYLASPVIKINRDGTFKIIRS